MKRFSTNDAMKQFLATDALPGASEDEIDQILALYPDDPTLGSPFGTGTNNELFPHFKQLAAIEGDLEFQGLRRFFLNQTSAHQPSWTYRMSHCERLQSSISSRNS